MTIQEILNSDDKKQHRALFSFDSNDSNEAIRVKFNLWARFFFSKYFESNDALFHKQLDLNNIRAYRGNIDSFTDIVFRGGAKTVRTKLFIAFAILNDLDHFRKFIKVLSSDIKNSKQIVTDVYNMFITVNSHYPEIFEKSGIKREESMMAFTTSTGVKVLASTVGVEQRGSVQENARPDLIWLEDIESRMTLRSLVKTKAIWDNIEEARTGLSIGGSMIATCNYISEAGNVHKLVEKESDRNVVMIVPIIEDDGTLNWGDRYSLEDIKFMKQSDEDYEGERLCKPSAGADIMFDRTIIDEMKVLQPLRDIAGFKIFKEYDPSHRYGSGHDTAGGLGLDSSTSVFIDFETYPAQVVATFNSNTIAPEAFGDEIYREGEYFNNPICAIENNKYDQTILKAKLLGVNLFAQKKDNVRIDSSKPTTYGWNTNSVTKSTMLTSVVKAVNDGLLVLNDKDLIAECRSYTRNDLIDDVKDPRLTTRHFDLLIALAIAFQTKDEARVAGSGMTVHTAEHLAGDLY